MRFFFSLFLQFIESVSYRLEDLKSGTVKVRSLFYILSQLYQINQSPPYRSIAFLRNDNIFTWYISGASI